MNHSYLLKAVFILIGSTAGANLRLEPECLGAELDHRTDLVERLIRALGSDQFEEREQAATALIAMGNDAVKPLMRAASGKDPEVVRRAKDCLLAIGRNQQVAVHIASLQSMDAKVRARGADRLGELGPLAFRAVPDLVRALNDKDEEVRFHAIIAIRAIGTKAEAAVPELIRVLEDKANGDHFRWRAADALQEIRPQAKSAVPVLLRLLEEDNVQMKNAAVSALGVLGDSDERVVPALIKALAHEKSNVHAPAAFSLGRLGKNPEKGVPAILDFLMKHKKTPSYSASRISVLSGLEKYRHKAKSAVPYLLEVIKDETEHEEYRERAVAILPSVDADPKVVIPILQGVLKRLDGPSPLRFEIKDYLADVIDK